MRLHFQKNVPSAFCFKIKCLHTGKQRNDDVYYIKVYSNYSTISFEKELNYEVCCLCLSQHRLRRHK